MTTTADDAMHSTSLQALAESAASELWNWIPDLDYEDRSSLVDDILGLIFRVQAESLAASDAILIEHRHELPLNGTALLVCEVEQICGGPQHFLLYYTDPYDHFLPIREWQDSEGAAVLTELMD